jgi:hypothetical protein
MMVAVFVVPDFPWWFVLVLAAVSLPWWARVAVLAAVTPPPGMRRRWRWAAGIGGAVAAGVLHATMGLVASRVEGVGVSKPVDQAMWTANAGAVVAAVVLLLLLLRRRAAVR